MRKATRNNDLRAVVRSREFRREMGVSERVLWTLLRHERTGFKFRRQYPAGPYFLDFFCREASLAIEVDGEQHAERAEKDATRDAWLASRDIEVVRIPSFDLFESTGLEIGRWVATITDRCEERSGRSSRLDAPTPGPSPVTNPTGEGS